MNARSSSAGSAKARGGRCGGACKKEKGIVSVLVPDASLRLRETHVGMGSSCNLGRYQIVDLEQKKGLSVSGEENSFRRLKELLTASVRRGTASFLFSSPPGRILAIISMMLAWLRRRPRVDEVWLSPGAS